MSSGGFQALSAHTAETELKVLGQLLVKKKKKELFLQIRGALAGVLIAALAEGWLRDCRSGIFPVKSLQRLGTQKPGAWHPLLVCAQTAGGQDLGC